MRTGCSPCHAVLRQPQGVSVQNENSQSIKRIVIAGGGTSGWMAAALLSRHLRADMCEVTVVAPDDGAGLGVGEATIPSMLRLLSTLQILHRQRSLLPKVQLVSVCCAMLATRHPLGLCKVNAAPQPKYTIVQTYSRSRSRATWMFSCGELC